jgi:hypothetical protein
VFVDGLATVTGEYVGQRHEYGGSGGGGAGEPIFFQLDEGKKLVVTRTELEAKTPRLTSYLNAMRDQVGVGGVGGPTSGAGEPSAELTEPEKRALGVRVGNSMTHLLAWTRAKRSGKKLALVLETTVDLAGMGARGDTPGSDGNGDGGDGGEGEGGDNAAALIDGKDFESMLGALEAYHPKDADVVFLSNAVDAAMLGAPAPVMTLTKAAAWSNDLHFVPTTSNQPGAGFYLVTERFLDKVFPLIDTGGFHFVDEWLVQQCTTLGTLTCYQTTPALGRAAGVTHTLDQMSVGAGGV